MKTEQVLRTYYKNAGRTGTWDALISTLKINPEA